MKGSDVQNWWNRVKLRFAQNMEYFPKVLCCGILCKFKVQVKALYSLPPCNGVQVNELQSNL